MKLKLYKNGETFYRLRFALWPTMVNNDKERIWLEIYYTRVVHVINSFNERRWYVDERYSKEYMKEFLNGGK